MLHKKLIIGRWEVDFLFAPDGYDTEEALTYLYYADAPDYILRQAYHVLEDNNQNTGFTFSNQDTKEAVVVIGPYTSGDEFINTLCHEVHHLAVAIADSLGIDLDKETPAYLQGDTTMELAQIICKLGCKKCSKKSKPLKAE